MSRAAWMVIALLALLLASAVAFYRQENPAWAAWQARYNA